MTGTVSTRTVKLVYLHALTPVHSGTGQAVAVIDLPIAREKATGWPVIPASSMKGVVRDLLDPGKTDPAFGLVDQAGSVCFGDQRLLLMPVRSVFGTFAYVTCPLALTRFNRDRGALGLAELPTPAEPGSDAAVLLPPKSRLVSDGKVFLEDFDLKYSEEPALGTLAGALAAELFASADEKRLFAERFAVVSDQAFGFLCENATDVSARIALNDKGTTTGDGGNLWYEEAVPAEAVFAGPLIIEGRRGADPDRIVSGIRDTVLQIGGKASVGRGLCRVRVA